MSQFGQKILSGDLRALARAASLIENRAPESVELLHKISARAGRALILGITGPPGSGKSTLCDQLARVLRTEGKTVGIIAVDPSSPFSGGAILGDRIRMQQHHDDPGVFIRSMATRGALGGLAAATADLVTLLDAAGRDVVMIETVGIGQAEVEIARLAQVTIVVLVPGSGDDVQAMKAGVMEAADLFIINKADLPGSDELEQHLLTEIHVTGRDQKVLKTVASQGAGIEAVLESARESRSAGRHRTLSSQTKPAASIDHLGIAVKSVDEALGFYEKQLGLPVQLRETVEKERVNVAMLPLGGPRIELLEPSSSDSVIAKFLEKHGSGLHHIALQVPDLNATLMRLRSAGARILNEPRTGAGGHLYSFIHPASTGGVLLELIQE